MQIRWADIAFQLDDALANTTADAWRWLLPEPWRPLVSSMFGGLFLEKSGRGVYWLECPLGRIEQVADTADEFEAGMRSGFEGAWGERIDEWFLPDFVYRLHDAGKRPGPEQCFGLTVLPILEGGAYVEPNVFLVPRHEWLSLTGSLHEQMRDLPDGSTVKLVLKD